MWAWFDTSETLLKKLDYDVVARQGSVNFNIFAYFDGIEHPEQCQATISFNRPDGTLIGITFLMDNVEETMDQTRVIRSPLTPTIDPFVNGNNYKGFSFTPNDPAILGMAGTYEATIKVYYNNEVLTSGMLKFYAEPTATPTDYNISSTQWNELMLKMDELITDIASMVEANPTIPEGTTTTVLANIKIGDEYYTIPLAAADLSYTEVE